MSIQITKILDRQKDSGVFAICTCTIVTFERKKKEKEVSAISGAGRPEKP